MPSLTTGQAFQQLTSAPEAILDSKEITSTEAHLGMWSAREIISGNGGGHLHRPGRLLRDKLSNSWGGKGSRSQSCDVGEIRALMEIQQSL